MTRNEIMAMEPGPEMDVLVAEKIMGWKLGDTRLWEGTIYSHYPPHKAYEYCQNHFFKPSSRINEAWSVVEKLDKSHNIEIGNTEGDWNCFIFGVCDVNAAKAPEAICKAALLTVMD